MVSKSESYHLVNKVSDEKLVGLIRLCPEKREYRLRLVNPADIKIAFSITIDPAMACVKIQPSYGKIKPRHFANVIISDNEQVNETITQSRLKLNYYWRDFKRSKSFAVKSLFIGIEREFERRIETKAEGYRWLTMRLIRSSFLAILIIYNVIIIKVCLYS